MAHAVLKDRTPPLRHTTKTLHTMKNISSASLLAALVAFPAMSFAGTAEKAAPAPVAPILSDISGTLSLNADSHFASFGHDVWGRGHNFLFHPSVEFTKTVTSDFKLILGTWWDVNSMSGPAYSKIGKHIQEIDVWGGASYTMGKVTVTGLFQDWMYNGHSEKAAEVKVSVDTFLKPALLVHQRFLSETGGNKDGTLALLSAGYDFTVGPVSFSIPAAVSVETSGYHGGKSGVGFGSLGLMGTIPVPFIANKATFTAGVTGYATNTSVIAYNKTTRGANANYVNLTAGISIPF